MRCAPRLPDLGGGGSQGSLTRRLAIGATVGAIVVALVLAGVLRSTLGLTDAQSEAERSAGVLAQATLVEKLVVDLETGLRGFVITGERRFLTPYVNARTEAPEATARLLEMVRGDRVQAASAAKIRRDADAYLRDFAEPLLEAGRPPADSRRAIEAAGEGKARLDALRAELADFTGRESARLSDRSAAADRRAGSANRVGLVALLILLALVAALAVLAERAVVRPVRRMARAVEQIRGGDLGVRLDPRGPAEIARLGTSIGKMAESLAESRAELEERNAELRRIGERNLVLLDNVFAQTPAGLAMLDRDLRYVRVNAAFAAMSGHSLEAHVGRRPGELSPGVGWNAQAIAKEVLATGEAVPDVEVGGTTAAEPGEERHWTVTHYPIREHGEVAGVGLVVLDVTADRRVAAELATAHEAERRARRLAEAARARASVLADAGLLVDSSLDVDETLANLAGLLVPRLADWCSIDIAVAGGRIRNAAVVHSDPAMLAMAQEMRDRYPPDTSSPNGAPAVIRSGRAELFSDIPRELVQAGARDADHLRLIESLGMVSAMVVPLTARGGTLGAITLVSAESGRRFDAEDLAVAETLGRRAALALDNARLYRERSEVARTLQAGLLPEVLPEIPGMRTEARFEPLGAADEVGGDFYDVFELDEGRWAVVIGDVCGKGAEAAALTALARYTLRAVAPLPPVEALRRLNEAILRQRDDLRFITIVYAELDLRAGRPPRMAFSSGGHPPLLVIPSAGPGRVVECVGTLIGVTPDPELLECTLDLQPGDIVALYTDGVTEASHADPLGAEALLELLGPDVRSARGVADGLRRIARSSPAPARDDVAILALQMA